MIIWYSNSSLKVKENLDILSTKILKHAREELSPSKHQDQYEIIQSCGRLQITKEMQILQVKYKINI